MYRVSSRSFPNRQAQLKDDAASIVPKEGYESDVFKNPYIAYNCCKIVGDIAIVSNGSHTDPIADKIALGLPIRDALALSMLAMDYEKDDYNTPRITAVVRQGGETGFLAVVRDNGINVHEFPIAPGECFYVSTYERNDVDLTQRGSFNGESAEACCDIMLGQGVFADFLNPVTAVAALDTGSGFELFAKDAGQ
jgi:IMP cyclohydrolase